MYETEYRTARKILDARDKWAALAKALSRVINDSPGPETADHLKRLGSIRENVLSLIEDASGRTKF